jgi:putative FmdB family regulatory protein
MSSMEDPLPTYQYACTECEHEFEQFQSFSDDALTVCPQCQGRLRKVFNAVGVVFKGSGFYRNDSRAPAADAKPAAKDGASTESSGSSGSSGGDSSTSTEKAGSTSDTSTVSKTPAKSTTTSGSKDSSSAA